MHDTTQSSLDDTLSPRTFAETARPPRPLLTRPLPLRCDCATSRRVDVVAGDTFSGRSAVGAENAADSGTQVGGDGIAVAGCTIPGSRAGDRGCGSSVLLGSVRASTGVAHALRSRASSMKFAVILRAFSEYGNARAAAVVAVVFVVAVAVTLALLLLQLLPSGDAALSRLNGGAGGRVEGLVRSSLESCDTVRVWYVAVR